jgi:hypothetical protein
MVFGLTGQLHPQPAPVPGPQTQSSHHHREHDGLRCHRGRGLVGEGPNLHDLVGEARGSRESQRWRENPSSRNAYHTAGLTSNRDLQQSLRLVREQEGRSLLWRTVWGRDENVRSGPGFWEPSRTENGSNSAGRPGTAIYAVPSLLPRSRDVVGDAPHAVKKKLRLFFVSGGAGCFHYFFAAALALATSMSSSSTELGVSMYRSNSMVNSALPWVAERSVVA